jgi:hypothetical protein
MIRESSLPSCTDHQHFRLLFQYPCHVFNGKFTQTLGAPRGDKIAMMKTQAAGVAAFSNQKAVVFIATEKKFAFTGFRRNIRCKRGTSDQGLASISASSSSLEPKRPSSASMTGLAM